LPSLLQLSNIMSAAAIERVRSQTVGGEIRAHLAREENLRSCGVSDAMLLHAQPSAASAVFVADHRFRAQARNVWRAKTQHGMRQGLPQDVGRTGLGHAARPACEHNPRARRSPPPTELPSMGQPVRISLWEAYDSALSSSMRGVQEPLRTA
jgi:hypothetical protein